jgi:C1A family cysteine protease
MLAACKIAAATFNMEDMCNSMKTENTKFMEHVAEQGLNFGTQEEYLFRQAIFEAKDKENDEINANPENTFTVGHNQFSTWTDAEYKRLLGYRAPKNVTIEETVLSEVDLPTSIDWRTRGAVNPVKNQGQCGSCWAFSATAAIEGHHAIQQGQLLSLAEQQLVDCDNTCYGCNGGW